MKIFKTLLIGIALFIGIFFTNLYSKISLQEDFYLLIEPGMSMNDISIILKSKDVIYMPFFLNQFSRISGKSKKIKAGEYMVSSDESVVGLLNKITTGDTFTREIRLSEGMTFYDVMAKLNNTEGLIDDIGNSTDQLILKKLNSSYLTLEGIFSPDTFYFERGANFTSILKRAYEQQENTIQELWESRIKNLPYKNIQEVLTLASIIEKEGIEKSMIAGVFINRLNKNMKLQSDPTIIYALGEDFSGDIKRRDLRFKHPYNTYINKGLPPGPIGLVSLSSFKAALNPDISTNLYFVSKGDGTHQFSVTLEQHNQAVKDYQLK